MADDRDKTQTGILGDITPPLSKTSSGQEQHDEGTNREGQEQEDESMSGGSRHGRVKHSGSRDVTEGVTGGTGTEVGGTRNNRTGSGATGGDIGNRPE